MTLHHPIDLDHVAHRRSIRTPIFMLDGRDSEMSYLDFMEHVEEAMGDLTYQEKRTARISLDVAKHVDGAWLQDVAILRVSYTQFETDEQMTGRLEEAAEKRAISDSLRDARDRLEYARLTRLFAPVV